MMTVPDMLRQSADTYEQRNKVYGDNYKRFGPILAQFFPNSIHLESEDDHKRFGVLVQIVSKLTRYAENFRVGGHDDSLLDMTVYATMLRELDMEAKARILDCVRVGL